MHDEWYTVVEHTDAGGRRFEDGVDLLLARDTTRPSYWNLASRSCALRLERLDDYSEGDQTSSRTRNY